MPGPYQDLVKALCGADPTLRHPDRKAVKRNVPWPGCLPRLVVLKVQGDHITRELETRDPSYLQKHFEQRKSEKCSDQRLIYILEGLSPEFVGVLGGQFMMHPSFFTDHKLVSRAAVDHRGEEILLPSMAAARDHICLKYTELLPLPNTVNAEFGLRCAETGRHLAITRMYGEFSQIVALSRKCSFWHSTSQKGGWDGMLFVINLVGTHANIKDSCCALRSTDTGGVSKEWDWAG